MLLLASRALNLAKLLVQLSAPLFFPDTALKILDMLYLKVSTNTIGLQETVIAFDIMKETGPNVSSNSELRVNHSFISSERNIIIFLIILIYPVKSQHYDRSTKTMRKTSMRFIYLGRGVNADLY